MTCGNDATHWHEIARHLVQAHRADADALTSYAPTLEQLHFAHADTHEALASCAGVKGAEPDSHIHSEPLDPGYPYVRECSFRPFPPGPNASCRIAGVPYFGWETCLPQTFWENGVPPAYQEAFQESLAEADLDRPEPEAGQ
jgi:hypothetical protein